MNLEDFEKSVEKKIVTRGRSYYKNDLIEDVEQVSSYEYCGTALGTRAYNVYVKLDAYGSILAHSCDCPYDWGATCKHEVALFYYLKNHQDSINKLDEGKMAALKVGLKNLSKREIVTMVLELSKSSKSIRDEFCDAIKTS